ncbi:hypothetical protein [Mesorhizobium sp.]|nr:hypothetical protein [Mesorhizobium sp.]
MDTVPELINNVGQMPIEHVLGLVALGAIGLAAFAIHAVSSHAKGKDRK